MGKWKGEWNKGAHRFSSVIEKSQKQSIKYNLWAMNPFRDF